MPLPPRKKVLMLITEMGMGGAEKVFYDHLQAFSAYHDLTACVFSKKGFDPAWEMGVPILELDDASLPGNPASRFLYRRKKLEAIVREGDFDVCIAHMEGPNILLCWSNLGLCKKILTVHGTIRADGQKSRLKTAVLNRLVLPLSYRRANGVVAVSRGLGEELEGIGLPKGLVHAIPNFIDSARIVLQKQEPLEEWAALFTAHRMLLSVGRLHPQKAQHALLHTLAAMRQDNRTEKLCLVGDGSLHDDLVALAGSLSLSAWTSANGTPPDETHDVYFAGRQSNPYRFMSRAALLLLPSHYEGFGLVVAEALQCGLPVIATDCPVGPREILQPGGPAAPQALTSPEQTPSGMLMPLWRDAADAPTWAGAIAALLDDPSRLHAARDAALTNVSRYHKEAVVGQWLNLIQSD